MKFCPACGTETLDLSDPQPVYSKWQEFTHLAGLDSTDFDTVKLVESLYELWQPLDGDPASFIEFVKQQMEPDNDGD